MYLLSVLRKSCNRQQLVYIGLRICAYCEQKKAPFLDGRKVRLMHRLIQNTDLEIHAIKLF